MRRVIFLFMVQFIVVGVLSTISASAAGKRIVSIGTGGIAGVYYPAGAAICRLLNRTRSEHETLCVTESTTGSVSNLTAIAANELDIGIVQSDWQYHAYRGTSKFANQGANKELRAVFSLHPEPFTVVARRDLGIMNFTDLKGKRVNIGNPGSGQRGTMEVVMAAFGWGNDDFALVAELDSSEQSQALCEDKFDAMVYTVGHPSSSITEATSSCDVALVNVVGPIIDKLVTENDFYRSASIPAGMYRGTAAAVTTFGVGATLVASSRVPDEVVYHIVKVVFENFTEFQRQHPAFSNLKKTQMIKDGLSAPLHPGAIKYYKEVGLM